ncbi:Uncharacterised protein at_DN1339 [Pycnogonum litorale]
MDHPHLGQVCAELGLPKDVLITYLFNGDTINIRNTSGLQGAFQYEAEQTRTPRRWCTLLHVLGLSSVLGKDIVSVFPDVPLVHRQLIHTVIHPLSTSAASDKYPCRGQVFILWSRDGNLDTREGRMYEPNHVVPLLPRSEACATAVAAATPSSSKRKQSKLDSFFRTKSSQRGTATPIVDCTLPAAPDTHATIPPLKDLPEPGTTTTCTQDLENDIPSTEQHNAIDCTLNHAAQSHEDTESPTVAIDSGAKAKKSRSFKAGWFKEFPWLTLESNLMKCKVCCKVNKRSVFTSGKSADNPRKDDLSKHDKSTDHCDASKLPERRQEMKAAVVRSHTIVKDAIIAHMVTLLTMAREAITTMKVSTLLQMQVKNGVHCLKTLLPTVNNEQLYHYQHSDSSNDFYGVLADMVRADNTNTRQQAPFPFYSIEADEATDVSDKSIVIVYVRHLNCR